MATPIPVLTIAYSNVSSDACPPHGVLRFFGDIREDNGGIRVEAGKPNFSAPGGDQFALDDGKGTSGAASGSYSNFGQCIVPLTGVFWAHYIGADPPGTAWEKEVGPVDGEWHVDDTGTGFVYAGLHEPDNERILVMQLAGGGGNFIEGRLTSGITPASNELTGANTFTFRRFIVLDGTVTPKILQEADEDEVGVNRDTTLSANVDAYVHLKKLQGEWRPSPVSDKCRS